MELGGKLAFLEKNSKTEQGMKFIKLFIAVAMLNGFISFDLFSQGQFFQVGTASYYADKFEGRTTANGEKYNGSKMTAAHRMLPFGTMVMVTNLKNNKSVEVKINDRGPFVEGRIIDLSRAAAEKLDFIQQGLAEVRIEVVKESKEAVAGAASHKRVYEAPMKISREYHELYAKAVSPRGFGVQIGSYGEFANMVAVVEHLKRSYQKKVIVEVGVVNEQKVYKIIVGGAKSRGKGEDLRMSLRKDFPECFVYEF
jgi:peptidoglycan lytic transglycosylase